MPFVKLDTGILDSSLWIDPSARTIFITALLMAEPFELEEAAEQLEIRRLKPTGFIVPPGWYGLARSAGSGIVRRALMDMNEGMAALKVLSSPDEASRSKEYGGRRLVRVNGGFIVLNYIRFREMDHTAAERSRRYRERKKRQQELNFTPEISEATQKVMRDLNLTDSSLKPVIQAVLINQDGKPEMETAEQMVKVYRQYLGLGQKGLLRYTWKPATFFSQGHWANDGSWPIDKERMAEIQRSRVGSM
jgi:hypothetical protein